MSKKPIIIEPEIESIKMPISFEDVIGQDGLKAHIKNLVSSKRISHAYIIDGEQGMGKMKLAYAFAASIQCENPINGSEACGLCPSCRNAIVLDNQDIRVIKPDADKKSMGPDIFRDQLIDDMALPPLKRPYKVYIIPSEPRLTAAAQNALLKSLEEPPSYAVIILLTNNSDALLETVRSRSVIFKMRPAPDSSIASMLEKSGVESGIAHSLASFSMGNPGKANALVMDESFKTLRDIVSSFALDIYLRKNSSSMRSVIETRKQIVENKDRVQEILSLILSFFRDLLMIKSGQGERVAFQEQLIELKEVARLMSFERLNTAFSYIDEARLSLEFNGNIDLVIEELLLKLRGLGEKG
ncbi:MAG: hypothetical protein J6P05_06200 [Lachnospiraceae bacterium]|nr:hypothetical protein [Lachnospiraceae bacterium]